MISTCSIDETPSHKGLVFAWLNDEQLKRSWQGWWIGARAYGAAFRVRRLVIALWWGATQ